jgi:hypothetical protein
VKIIIFHISCYVYDQLIAIAFALKTLLAFGKISKSGCAITKEIPKATLFSDKQAAF